MAGKDKPKVSGLSFNLFAIFGVLIILPISTAFITNLSNTQSGDYESLTWIDESYVNIPNDPEFCPVNQFFLNGEYDKWLALRWVDKGDNLTSLFEDIYGTNDPYIYESIWNEDFAYYQFMAESCTGFPVQRDNNFFYRGYDNHFVIRNQAIQGNIPGYLNDGYIGYSGDDFTFATNNQFFKYMDDSKDLADVKFEFIDYETNFDCANSIFENITFEAEITIRDNYNSKKYTGFEYDTNNKFKVNYDPRFNPSTFCHVGLTFDFDFSPIESIELNEIFTDYDNLSVEVRLYNFESEDDSPSSQIFPALPFLGDDKFGYSISVSYVDNVAVNFWLSGGTFLLGVLLFLLAIANTPYWNPVINFFQGAVK